MSNELKHKDVGTGLDQTEWVDTDTHTLDAGEQGDTLYFDGTYIKKLAHGTAGQILGTGGHGANPAWGGNLVLLDDTDILNFGTSSDAKLLWETADANANALILALPDSGATNVPVLAIGDQGIINKDLTWFNGQLQPHISIVNATEYRRLEIGPSDQYNSEIFTDGANLYLRTWNTRSYSVTISNTASNVPTLYGTGAYLRIGDAGTTGHTLASEDDLMVSGKLEVDGAAYLDSSVYLGGGNSLFFNAAATYRITHHEGDANAHFFSFQGIDTSDIDVPVFIFADNNLAWNTDLGAGGLDFSAYTFPTIAVLDADRDSWIGIGHTADDVPALRSSLGDIAYTDLQLVDDPDFIINALAGRDKTDRWAIGFPINMYARTTVGSAGGYHYGAMYTAYTGGTASSSIAIDGQLRGLADLGQLEWHYDKTCVFRTRIQLNGTWDANCKFKMQIKETTNRGDLAAKGFGIQVINKSIYTESYGAHANLVDSTIDITDYTAFDIMIVHKPGVSLGFYHRVAAGAWTTLLLDVDTNHIPSGDASAAEMFVISLENGAGATTVAADVNTPWIGVEN